MRNAFANAFMVMWTRPEFTKRDTQAFFIVISPPRL